MDFNRDWRSYLTGFGNLDHEYWFGNQHIHLLTTNSSYQLRIDMMDANKETHQVTYDVFYISDALSGFRLFIDGFHGNGDLKDDLSIEHSGIAGGMGTVFV